MIDPDKNDRLVLRNPANYKSGFWTSFKTDRGTYYTASTEPIELMKVESKTEKDGLLRVVLNHTPEGETQEVLQFKHSLWSKNKPYLLWRFTTKNVSNSKVKDLRVYALMDFDVGGPTSYKDDMAQYDTHNNVMVVFDDNPVSVAMTSKTEPHGWGIKSPINLKITQALRDLPGNTEEGPKDLAVGLQWNLGHLPPDESRDIDLLLSIGSSREEAIELIPNGLELFDKKLR